MTDINNSIGADKVKQVPNMNFEGQKSISATPQNYEQKEIKNLDNAHSALVGRSMVKKMQKTATPEFNPEVVAGVKESLASLKGNERTVAFAGKVFDVAIAKGYSYEQAAKMEAAAVEDFKG